MLLYDAPQLPPSALSRRLEFSSGIGARKSNDRAEYVRRCSSGEVGRDNRGCESCVRPKSVTVSSSSPLAPVKLRLDLGMIMSIFARLE
jgi:hypothetical protein